MWTPSLPSIGLTIALGMSVVACGGASAPEATPAVPTADETVAATPAPTEPGINIAMVDSSLGLAGVNQLNVRAGETVEIDLLLYNDNTGNESVALKVREADTGLAVTTGATSLRLSRHEVVVVRATIVVSEDVATGDSLRFTIQAVLASDTVQRSNLQVTLAVTNAATDRPNVTNNNAQTGTNEKVLAFVIGDDTGTKLDTSTLRVVGGAFRASSTEAENGFVTYVPFANVTGPDALIYEVCTTDGICDTGVLRVAVNPAG